MPQDWRRASVHPVYKGGNLKQPENYRLISLTCICCKLMERILTCSITAYLEESNQFSRFQFGFRNHLSCESQLIMLCQDTFSALDHKHSVDLAFIDFSKAFDKVSHYHLIRKLETYNLDKKVIEWIKAFLLNRTQSVVVDNCHSDEIQVTSGVPQGSVLGPILFLLYINDLPDRINCSIRMYTDDVLYTDVSDMDSTHKLQANLDALLKWCIDWKMTVNVNKCAVMRMSRNKCAIVPKYFFNNSVIPVVEEFKYLGVFISNTCSWQRHIQYVTSRGNQMLRFVKRNFEGCPREVKEIVYTSLVTPLIEYASCVWDPNAEGMKRNLEMIQRRAARFTLNDHSRESNVTDMLSAIGWDTLEARRKVSRLCFLFKLYHDDSRHDTENIILRPDYIGRNDHPKKIRRIQSRLLLYHNSFFPKTIREWNQLDINLAAIETLSYFKAIL